MNAVSTPSHEMRTGTTAAPMPIDASQSIWMTPNTRARTSSGTARCTSVSPATSTSELPTPINASATTATASSCHTPIAIERDPDQHDSRAEGRAQALGTGQRERTDRADERADPDRRVQVTDAAVSEVEQLERGDDDEDLDRTEDRGLRRQEHHHQAQRAIPEERREPCEPLGHDRRRLELPSRASLCSTLDEQEEERRGDDEKRRDGEHEARARDGEEHVRPAPGRRTPRRSRHRLATAFAAVSSSGVRARDGRERRLGRPEGRRRDRRRDRESVDDPRIGVREHARARPRRRARPASRW